jgi:hypothetical protein
MDKTLGSPSVIDSTNIERLVDAMRKSLAAEAFAQADEKVKSVQEEAKAVKRDLTGQLRKVGSEAERLRGDLARTQEINLQVAGALVTMVNKRIRRRRKVATVLGVLGLLAFEALPFALGMLEGNGALVGTAIVYALTILAHFTGQLRKLLFDPIFRRLDHRTLERAFLQIELKPSELGTSISYSEGAFEVG